MKRGDPQAHPWGSEPLPQRRTGSRRFLSEDGGWEITYCGFILILLCLFIMLSSFASMERGKIFRFVRSFNDAMGILPGGVKMEKGKEVLPDAPDVVEKTSSLALFVKEVYDLVAGLDLSNKVEITYDGERVVLRISDTVLFEVGVAAVNPEAFSILHRLGVLIKNGGYAVSIEGHTDNIPIRTRLFPSNWELSTSRAVSVLRYFTEQEGIPLENLSALGFGEFQPLFPNDSQQSRSRNRRVEIVVTKKVGRGGHPEPREDAP